MERICITERAVWAILRGEEPPLSLSDASKDAIIEIVSILDGRPLCSIHPKFWPPKASP